jgi:hypothetical protein
MKDSGLLKAPAVLIPMPTDYEDMWTQQLVCKAQTNLLPLFRLEPRTPVVQFVASHYTDWATLVLQ